MLCTDVDVGWPVVDVLALSDTNQFYNNVIRSLMSQKSMPFKVSIVNLCVNDASRSPDRRYNYRPNRSSPDCSYNYRPNESLPDC